MVMLLHLFNLMMLSGTMSLDQHTLLGERSLHIKMDGLLSCLKEQQISSSGTPLTILPTLLISWALSRWLTRVTILFLVTTSLNHLMYSHLMERNQTPPQLLLILQHTILLAILNGTGLEMTQKRSYTFYPTRIKQQGRNVEENQKNYIERSNSEYTDVYMPDVFHHHHQLFLLEDHWNF